MGRHYSHLDLEKRSRLADWLEAGVPVAEIALKLGRAPSTIYLEIRRNRFVDNEWSAISGYYGKIAQRNYEELAKNQNRRSRPVMEKVIIQLAPLPRLARRSITFDRGTEFTAWAHLKAGIGADAWFCAPQAPWQKGSVENTNNRLRKYLPRRRDPNTLTTSYLRAVAEHLNTTPRKCLGYRTPTEVFRKNLFDLMDGKE